MLAPLLLPAIKLPSLLIWTGYPRCLFLAGANQERVALSEPHSSGPSGRKSDVSPRQKQTLMRSYAPQRGAKQEPKSLRGIRPLNEYLRTNEVFGITSIFD